MAILRRLTHSCLTLATDEGTFLLDPDFHTFDVIDLDSIGDVQRVLITHEHRDHVHPDFIRWLVDRGEDVTVHGNRQVVDLLAEEGIAAVTANPTSVTSEDVIHETVPNGSAPPNRSFTVAGVLTHPGDSFQPTHSAAVLALPVITPWGSATQAVAFARRLAPAHVLPVHDFYLTPQGRQFVAAIVGPALEAAGIELLSLDWGEQATV